MTEFGKIFTLFDRNKNGSVSIAEFKKAIRCFVPREFREIALRLAS